MDRLSARIGYWAALLCTLTFVVWLVAFVAILVVNPLYLWTDYADFLVYNATTNSFFAQMGQAAMLLFVACFVILLAVVQEAAPPAKRILARIAVYFAILCAGTVGIHYFTQISVVRINLAAGHGAGLEQFVQANPYSYSSGINMLGWTLFLGLSSAFAAALFPLFEPGDRLQSVIKWAFALNAVSVLLGGVAFVADWVIVVGITMNLCMGGALTTLSVAFTLLFRRYLRETA